jgi:hypothetical protein
VKVPMWMRDSSRRSSGQVRPVAFPAMRAERGVRAGAGPPGQRCDRSPGSEGFAEYLDVAGAEQIAVTLGVAVQARSAAVEGAAGVPEVWCVLEGGYVATQFPPGAVPGGQGRVFVSDNEQVIACMAQPGELR